MINEGEMIARNRRIATALIDFSTPTGLQLDSLTLLIKDCPDEATAIEKLTRYFCDISDRG